MDLVRNIEKGYLLSKVKWACDEDSEHKSVGESRCPTPYANWCESCRLTARYTEKSPQE